MSFRAEQCNKTKKINISIINKLFITGQGELIADCTYNQGSQR